MTEPTRDVIVWLDHLGDYRMLDAKDKRAHPSGRKRTVLESEYREHFYVQERVAREQAWCAELFQETMQERIEELEKEIASSTRYINDQREWKYHRDQVRAKLPEFVERLNQMKIATAGVA